MQSQSNDDYKSKGSSDDSNFTSEIYFKKNKKIIIFFKFHQNKNLPIQEFNIWHNHPTIKNNYFKVETLKEALNHFSDLYTKLLQLKTSTKVVYNFNKLKFGDDQKLSDLENEALLFWFDKIQFIDCSTQFIIWFFQSFFNAKDLNHLENKKLQQFSFKKCKISDFHFIKVLDNLRYLSLGFHTNTVISFSKCHNITDQTLNLLASLELDTSKRQSDFKNLGLKICSQSQISPQQIKNIAYTAFAKCLIKLKLTDLNQCIGEDVLKEILSYRQNYGEQQEIYKLQQMQEISFDRTVCNQFDQLPLHLNWDGLIKISYNGFNSQTNQRDTITFNKIFPLSFPSLTSLKMRGCILTKEFFENLGHMSFLFQLQVLDFENCQINLEGFKQFLSLGELNKLDCLNLKSTNINDDICSIIGAQTSLDAKTRNLLKLSQINISNIQSEDFTHKGIKYLLQSNHLIKINITHNDCVDDTLADHIIQLINSRIDQIAEYNTELSLNDFNYSDDINYLVGDMLLNKINLDGCKNITSGFFMALHSQNMLKYLKLLNVSGTNVCNNFINILTGIDAQRGEEEQKKGNQTDKQIKVEKQNNLNQNAQTNQSKESKTKNSALQSDNLKKNEMKNAANEKETTEYQKKEIKSKPSYYDIFNPIYKNIVETFKLEEKKPVQMIKKSFNTYRKKYERIYNKVNDKIFKEKKIEMSKKKPKTKKKKQMLMGENRYIQGEEQTPIVNLQYLNISKCKLINGEGLYNLLTKCQSRLTIRYLNISGLNFYDKVFEKDTSLGKDQQNIWKQKNILEIIIQTFQRLEKLDISDNLLPYQNYTTKIENIKLIKLKANQTNFDLEFFKQGIGCLQELQLRGCKQITYKKLDSFIQSISNIGSEVFDIFKFLGYFKNLVNDDLILYIVKKYQKLEKFHYWNLQNYNLLELDYNQIDMDSFLLKIFDKQSIEDINLSNTRVCNNFVRKYMQYKDSKVKTQLCLNGCPLIDDQVFEKLFKSNQKRAYYHKPMSVLRDLKHCLTDDNITFLSQIQVRDKKSRFSQLDLEQNQLLTEKGLIKILRSSFMNTIKSINFNYTQVSDEVLKIFTTNLKSKEQRFPRLEQISIQGCKNITRDGLQSICESQNFNQKFNLDCVFSLPHLIDLDLAKIISHSQYFCNIVTLNLSKFSFQSIDIMISQLFLKGKDQILNLVSLNLSNTWVSDHGLQFMSVSVILKNLQRIYLENCPKVYDKGISYLIESTTLKSLDIQFMLLQTGSKCGIRVYDTIYNDPKFLSIQELEFKESKLNFDDIKRILEKIKNLNSIISIKFTSLASLSQQESEELFSFIYENLDIKYLIYPQEVLDMKQVFPLDFESKKTKVKQSYLKNYLSQFKKYKNNIEECLQTEPFSQIEQIQTSFQQIKLPPSQYKMKKNLNLSYFVRKNKNILNSSYLDFLFVNFFRSDQLRFNIDFSNNQLIKEESFIRYFSFTTQNIEIINISNTRATEKTIISILSNSQLRNIKTIIFDDCRYMNYELALTFILKARKKLLLKQQIFFQYKKYITDKLLKLYCSQVLNTSFTESRYNKRVSYYSVLDDFYKLSRYFLQKYTQSKQDSSLISKILDLSGSKVNLIDLKFSVGFQSRIKILNLSSTLITNQNFKSFFQIKVQPAIQQVLRYIWVDNTFQLEDELDNWKEYFDGFVAKNFNFNELLYSKGEIASLILDAFNQSTNPKLLLQNLIQFELLPSITKEQILNVLETQNERKNSTIKQISIVSTNQNNHYEHIKTNFNSKIYKNLKGIVVKGASQGTYSITEEKYPLYILHNQSDLFKGLSFNNSVDYLLKCDQFHFLRILDLSNSIITFQSLITLFENIDSNNQIEEINLSNHTIVTDKIIEILIKRNGDVKQAITEPKLQINNSEQHEQSLIQSANSLKESISIQESESSNINNNSLVQPPLSEQSKVQTLNNDQQNIQDQNIGQKEEKSQQQDIMNLKQNRVFRYLKKLTILNTSVTQSSLISLLKELPFNEMFKSQDILDQYTQICEVTDPAIIALSESPYLRNIHILNLSNCQFSCDSFLTLIKSDHCVNIKELYLNCQFLNESIFIMLAKTKNLPCLEKFIANNYEQCYQSLGYLAQAKYFDLNFNIETSTLLNEKLIYQSNKFINTLIGSIYMRNVKVINFDNMNEQMLSLKEFFSLAKYCKNVQTIKLSNINDKKKYYFIWKELADSKCFPNLESIQIDSIKYSENLHALLQQKNKPFIQLDKLLQNQNIINSETLDILSKQQTLLNSRSFQIPSLLQFEQFSEAFQKTNYLYNIQSIDITEYSVKEKDIYSQKSITQQKDFWDIEKKEIKGQIMPLPNVIKPINTDQALESISKCFPNLERVTISKSDIISEDVDLAELVKFFITYQRNQSFSVDFEIITLMNEITEKNIKVPFEFPQLLLSSLFQNNRYQNLKDLNLSFLELSSIERERDDRNLLQDLDFTFTTSLTFIDLNQFYQFILIFNNKYFQNLRSINILDTNPNKLPKEKLKDIDRIVKGWNKITNNFQRIALQALGQYLPSLQNSLTYNSSQLYQSNIEVICFQENQFRLKDGKTEQIDQWDIIFMAQNLIINILSEEFQISNFFKLIIQIYESQKNRIQVKYNKIEIKGNKEKFGKISVEQFDKLCELQIFSEQFDLNEFLVKYLNYQKAPLKYIELYQASNLPCFSNIQVLRIPILEMTSIIQNKLDSILQLPNLKKIIFDQVKNTSGNGLTRLFQSNSIKNRPYVQIEINQIDNIGTIGFFEDIKGIQKNFQREVQLILKLSKEKDSQQTDVSQKKFYSQAVSKILTNNNLSNYLTKLVINQQILQDIINGLYKETIQNNIQQIHFEFIPLFIYPAFIKFFSEYQNIQSITFDPISINNSRNQQNKFSKIDQNQQIKTKNQLHFLLQIFEKVENVKILNSILSQFSDQIDSNLLKDIANFGISRSLTRISFANNQFLESQPFKINLKKQIENKKINSSNLKGIQDQNLNGFDSKIKKSPTKKKDNSLNNDEISNSKDNKILSKNTKQHILKNQIQAQTPQQDPRQSVVQMANYQTNLGTTIQGDYLKQRKNNEFQKEESQQKNKGKIQQKQQGYNLLDNEEELLDYQNQYQNFTKEDVQLLIDEDQLKEFLNKLPSLNEIDFSCSTIKHDHIETLKSNLSFNQISFINFDKCFNLTRISQLIQLITDNFDQSFQFDKYVGHLPYNNIKTRKQVKKIVENIIKNPFFLKNCKNLNLSFIQKIKSKQISSDCFKGVFDPILNGSTIDNIMMSSFLQSLPYELKQIVSDDLIKFLTEKYKIISFIQPEHFSQIQYAFNYIIQQPDLENETRIIYLLNPRFQKSISASSFRLIYESIIVEEKQINNQEKEIEKKLLLLQKKRVNKQNDLKEIEKKIQEQNLMKIKLNNSKLEEIKQNRLKMLQGKNGKKNPAKQSKTIIKEKAIKNKEIQESSHQLVLNEINQDQVTTISRDEEDLYALRYSLFKKRILKFQNRINEQLKYNKILAESAEITEFQNSVDNYMLYLQNKSEQEYDQSLLIFQDIKGDLEKYLIQFNNVPNDDFKRQIAVELKEYKDYLAQNQKKKNENNEQQSKVQSVNENIPLNSVNNKQKDKLQEEKMQQKGEWKKSENKKTIQFSEAVQQIDENQVKKPSKFNQILQQNKSSMKTEVNKQDLIDESKNIKDMTNLIFKSYSKKIQSDDLVYEINKIKNSDKTYEIQKDKLNLKIGKYDSQIELLEQQKSRIEKQKFNHKNILQSQNILFELFDSINLSYNKYFNSLGLNKFLLSYINPWMNVNLNYQDIEQNQLINLKIIQKRKESNYYNTKVIPENNVQNQNQQNYDGTQYLLQQALMKQNYASNAIQNSRISQIVGSNHLLDDAIMTDLIKLISTKMLKVRKIQLSGLNVGDSFAEQFSLVLSNLQQVKFLKSIQLYHNRRISSFGLKFLFSSIVERIPYGFKIDISPSMYDFESLKKSLFLLEREFITKVFKISKQQGEKSEKIVNQSLGVIIKLNEERQNEINQKKEKGLKKEQDVEEDQDSEINEQNILNLNDQDNIEQMVKNAVRINKLRVQNIKDKLNISDYDEKEQYQQIPADMDLGTMNKQASFKRRRKRQDTKKEQNSDDDGDDNQGQEDNNDEEYEYEEMYIQMKQVDIKDDILDWNLLSYDGSLNKNMINVFRKKYGSEGESLINRIISIRKKYEKSKIQIKALKLEEEEDDSTVIIQNLVNEGLYDTINFLYSNKHQNKYRGYLISLAVVLFPLALFHYFQVITHKFHEWVLNFQFDEYFAEYFECFQAKYLAEITKIVPKTIGSQDFYFDEDVAKLNNVLSSQKTDNNEKRQELVIYKKYLNNPYKYQDIFKQFVAKQKSHILRHSYLIFFIYFFVFQIGICLILPFFLVTSISKDSCKNINWKYDIPFYVSSVFSVFIEFLMLIDLEYIISVKQIFSIKSTLAITLIYSSFMARYDQYTDALFTFKTLTCQELHDVDHRILYIGIACGVVMGINLVLSFEGFLYEMIQIKWKQISQNQDLHNTYYINQYTKVALISEFYGVGISLDRFSTSSATNLNSKFLPQALKNIKIPQIFLSKFQRVFVEDIPMIIILLIYNTYFITHDWSQWDNLKVILTTVLNLYHSLSQAWNARPSVFRTYQMQEYLEFREKHNDIYRLKVSRGKLTQDFDITQIKQKVNEFRKKYQNITIVEEKQEKVIETKTNKSLANRDNVSESRGKSDNQSQKSGFSGKKENQQSEESIKSQSHAEQQDINDSRNLQQENNNNNIGKQSKVDKTFSSEEFKEEIFKFILPDKE